jgi:DNA-binding XRE family transcriptional regulator
MTIKQEHTLTVGRYRVVGEYEAVPIDDAGTLGMPSTELGRLELQAAIAVLSEAESIHGEELRFARKAMGLRQPDLAALLDVAAETVSRWETGTESIRRQTQLAVLLYLEHTARYGEPVPLVAKNDNIRSPVRIIAA